MLVEYVVVRNHEISFIVFSFLLLCFKNQFQNLLSFFHCYFYHPLSSSLFHLLFVFKTTSYFVFTSPFHRLLTYHLLDFIFFYFFILVTKKNC